MYQTSAYRSTAVTSHGTSRFRRGSCTIKSILSLYFILVSSFSLFAQDSVQPIKKDSTFINCPEPPNKKEMKERITDPYHFSLTKKQVNNRVKIIPATNI